MDAYPVFPGDGDSMSAGDPAPSDSTPEFTDETAYTLLIHDDVPPPLELVMDRQTLSDLLGPSADQVLLLNLDPVPLIRSALDAIQNACGTAWKNDDSDPHHNCDLTALGRTFEGADGTWQSSPEYALVRLLTMTPANTVVEGTSIEGLQELADLLGIGGGFADILSDSLGIPRTTEIVPAENVVQALCADFLAPHSNTTPTGEIPITLEDALSDMATLTDRLGPVAPHPGVLDSTFPVHGVVFGPGFEFSVTADSNLRVLDGVDLGMGKDYLTVVVDTTGPGYNDELEFDFNDPARFSIVGLVDNPTVDLRFSLQEHGTFVPSCAADDACMANLPSHPVGGSSVWGLDPWKLEYVIADAAQRQYGQRVFQECYLLCAAEVTIGWDGNPPGWTTYDTLFSLGSPPGDQYLWEEINEVAQVSLHDLPGVSFPEGTVNPAFTVHGAEVGFGGDQLLAAVRPYLQAQADTISDLLLGNYRDGNGKVEVYFRRASSGYPFVFFLAPEDLAAGAVYPYARPGFYSGPELKPSDKVSRLSIPGVADTDHEKLGLVAGVTVVFAQDQLGQVFRLRFDVPVGDDPQEIRVYVARRR